jgi:hypothetical protein
LVVAQTGAGPLNDLVHRKYILASQVAQVSCG